MTTTKTFVAEISNLKMFEPSVDLRAIFIIVANTLSGIGLGLNLFLLYLIIVKTPRKISDYKIILLQNCFIDTVFIFGNFLVKGQTDYKNGAFFLIGSDYLNNIQNPYHVFFFMFYVFTLFFCVTSIPVQFLYRYFIICHGKTLSIFEYLFLLLISIFGALAFAVIFGYVVWPNDKIIEEKFQLLKEDNLYFRGIPKFVVAEILQFPLISCFTFSYFLVTVSYGITIFACLKVWKKLKKHEQIFSEETRKLHKQMTKTMIMQATVPLFLVLLPIGLGVTAGFAMINVPGLGMLFNSVCGWIPVANPLVTILSIKTYREVIIFWLRKLFNIQQPRRVSIAPSTLSLNVA